MVLFTHVHEGVGDINSPHFVGKEREGLPLHIQRVGFGRSAPHNKYVTDALRRVDLNNGSTVSAGAPSPVLPSKLRRHNYVGAGVRFCENGRSSYVSLFPLRVVPKFVPEEVAIPRKEAA